MCVGCLRILIAERRANNPALKSLSALGVTVKADGSVVNNPRDAVLHRDHLELSRFFRGRFCDFHNAHVVHQADERTNERSKERTAPRRGILWFFDGLGCTAALET